MLKLRLVPSCVTSLLVPVQQCYSKELSLMIFYSISCVFLLRTFCYINGNFFFSIFLFVSCLFIACLQWEQCFNKLMLKYGIHALALFIKDYHVIKTCST